MEVSLLLREEQGLALGAAYQFCVRMGDAYRLSERWSPPSSPFLFAVPGPVAIKQHPLSSRSRFAQTEEDNPQSSRQDLLSVRDVTSGSAMLRWPCFGQGDMSLLAQTKGRAGRLPVEYLLVLFGSGSQSQEDEGTEDGTPVASYGLDEEDAEDALNEGFCCWRLGGLRASSCYSANLYTRWARFGPSWKEVRKAGAALMCAFVTDGIDTGLVAEISAAVPRGALIPGGESPGVGAALITSKGRPLPTAPGRKAGYAAVAEIDVSPNSDLA